VQPYQEAGLGVANTLSASLNLALLVYALRRKLSRLDMKDVVQVLLVLVPAALWRELLRGLAWLWRKVRPCDPPAQAGGGFRAGRHRRAGLLAGGALGPGARRSRRGGVVSEEGSPTLTTLGPAGILSRYVNGVLPGATSSGLRLPGHELN